MSVAKFNESYLAAKSARIAELTQKLETRVWPSAELEELKKSNPDSNILKRYGDKELLSADPNIFALANEENYELCKKADAHLKVKNQLNTLANDARKPEDLLSDFFTAVNVGRLKSDTPISFEELAKLGASEYYSTILELHNNSELDTPDYFPVSVPDEILKDAITELGTNYEKSSKKSEGSPINEGATPEKKEEGQGSPLTEPVAKKAESTNSPLAEPEAKKSEETSSTVPSTTSTPAEIPAIANKEEAKPAGTTVNVNLEQTTPETKPVETQAATINEVTATAQSATASEKTTETETPSFVPVNANSIFYGGASEMSLTKNTSSPINVSEGSKTQNTSNATAESNSYLNLFNTVSNTKYSQPTSSTSSVINEATSTSESTANTENTETTQNSSSLTELTGPVSYSEFATQLMGENNVKALQNMPSISKENPKIPRAEASFANSEKVSQKPAETITSSQAVQVTPTEQSTQVTAQTETSQEKQNTQSSTESSPVQATASQPSVQNNDDVVERLARLERLLSGPLDVRLV